MSTTANRWFVPAEEYLAATEDYAVVGESAYFVKNRLIDDPTYFDILDGALAEDPEARLIDVLDDPLFHGDIYGTGEGERLVYADVDRDSEEHRQLWKAVAKAGFLEEESAEIKEAKEKLFEHLSAQCHCCFGESSDEDESSESKNKERAASIKETHERTGHVSSNMIDYVLKLESEQARRDVLTILSRQERRKSQRPRTCPFHSGSSTNGKFRQAPYRPCDCERNVRRDALKAKDAGKENVAQNAAKLYEQLLGQLQSFNLDPEQPL
ncbi:MAG: hypothetical protein Q9178_002648 [Gyalolechia marmorata]